MRKKKENMEEEMDKIVEEEESDLTKSVLREAFGDSSSESDCADCSPPLGDSSLRHALREAFGDSSSDSDHGECSSPLGETFFLLSCQGFEGEIQVLEPVHGIQGLWFCSNFLSSENQSSLLSAVYQDGWLTDKHNQAMRFGDLPSWALELSKLVHTAVRTGQIRNGSDLNLSTVSSESLQDDPLPFQLLWREPLFDQLIANVISQGICSHVDLMRFENGIAIISLESACVMQFTPVKENENVKEVPVYLTPGSLVLMHGEARYLWKHGINRGAGSQIWDGKEIQQKRRTSVTLRKLCPTS